MKKSVKFTIIALALASVLLVALYFIFNNKKEYVVSFDTDGGDRISSQTIVEGEKVSKPEDPTKENYVFYRWEYQGAEYDFNQAVYNDMTLKATWNEIEKTKYEVSLTVDGKKQTISVSELTENDLEGLGYEEKDGYVLKWYVDGKEYDFTIPLTGNVDITGKYEKVTTYTVKFNSNGGTTVSSQSVKQNEKAKEPANVTKDEYVLDGWYLNNVKYDFDTPVTKNITLVAKWVEDPNIKKYDVTFNSDGGTSVTKQRVTENKTATEPKAPTKTNYKFIEWQLDGTKYDFKTKVTKDIELKAKWEEVIQYTVTFNKDNGTANETKKVVKGEKVAKPANPTKSGHRFVEWLYNNQAFDFNNTPITSDITLVASYELIKTYTVTFNSNGGSTVSSQTIEEGKTATEPTKPTKANSTFLGWYLNDTKYVFSTKVNSNITLVAKWQDDSTYTISARRADTYSPDSILTVKKNGSAISVKEVKLNSGVHLCYGSNLVVMTSDIEGQTSLTVVLNDNTVVRATLE